MSETVPTYAVDGGVATITLNRPEAMNGLDVATKEALLDAVRRAAGRRRRALRGADRQWPGVLRRPGPQGARRDPARAPTRSRCSAPSRSTTTRSSRALATMPKPVVAAVNGVAAGAGASLAFACDFRVLTESAGFNLAFTGVALSCDTGVVVDAAPPRRPDEGDGAALLPAHHRLRGVARARPGHARGAGRRVRRRGRRAGDAAGRRADRRLRRDPALGGLLRLPRLRGVAGVRGDDDDAHRGPPRTTATPWTRSCRSRSRPTTGAERVSGWRPRRAAGRWVRSSAPGDGSPPGRTPR